MLVSLNWLKEFVDIKMDPQDLGNELTLKTAEVEKVEDQSAAFDHMVTGHVTSIAKHPNADRLQVAQVSVGKETLQIVCGGANLKEGMYVAVTKIGAKVKWHGEEQLTEIVAAKVRGVESQGMIAAAEEIGLEDPDAGDHDIMDLSAIKPDPGTPLAEIFKRDDVILEFDNKSLTHRPDLWGHYGIAREVATITGEKLKPYKPSPKIPEKGESPKVEIKDKDLCPRYCGLIINNVVVGESPEWLKAKLTAVGHGSHGNIVDITNYISAELGQPMHAFDKSFIEGGIVVRRAEKGEKITTLDDKKHTLEEDMLVIADHKKAVAIAGVMGGENSEINDKTTSIILEAATFDAGSIRRTSTKLGLRTDAVQRFEKALDPNLPEVAIKRAAELVLQLCPGATIGGPITDVQHFDKKALKIDLEIQNAQSKIGAKIEASEMKKILESLEFEVEKKNSETFTVTVPTFRATKDITVEDDLIEEVARIYGYENIAPTLPNLPIRLPKENVERAKQHATRELFSHALGFDEVYNYSFYGKQELENCLMTEDNHVKLLNYLSEDQTHIRTTLTPNILKNLQLNAKNFDTVKIYEIGRTYIDIEEFHPLETKRISGAIMYKTSETDPFYEAKGAVEEFLAHFNIKATAAKGLKNVPYAHPQKSLSYIDQNGQTIAVVFALHPAVQKNHDLEKHKVSNFSINLTEAFKLESPTRKFRPIPKFPGMSFDVSVLVKEDVEIQTLKEAIQKAAPKLIHSITLFDIYQGEHVKEGHKAVAFKIELLDPEKTLTDQTFKETQNKTFKNLRSLGGEIRGGK